jgi:hypothetical protein
VPIDAIDHFKPRPAVTRGVGRSQAEGVDGFAVGIAKTDGVISQVRCVFEDLAIQEWDGTRSGKKEEEFALLRYG